MARRVYADQPVVRDDVTTAPAAFGNALTALYVSVVAILGIDVLLQVLGSNGDTFTQLVDALSATFLGPFEGVSQSHLVTAVVAATACTVLYVIAMAATRRGRRSVH